MTTLLVSAALVAMGGAAMAHHSFAMFDQEHPIELTGVVKDWKYTAPHAFIILEVKDADGTTPDLEPRRRRPERIDPRRLDQQDLEARRRTDV